MSKYSEGAYGDSTPPWAWTSEIYGFQKGFEPPPVKKKMLSPPPEQIHEYAPDDLQSEVDQ